MARTGAFNPKEDAARLAHLSVDDLVRLFDQHAKDAKGMMEWIDRIARHTETEALSARLAEAIGQIAARSPMRADKLTSWGVLAPPSEPAASATAGKAAAGGVPAVQTPSE